MNKILRFSVVSTFVLLGINLKSQNVGINATGAAPDGGAMLDVSSANKGLLVPRVNITNLATIAPVVGSATVSMLVYNTNVGTGLGYYYWDGASWVRFSTGGDDWKITGNANATQGTNFLGTTNATGLDFRTNNTLRFRIANGNQVQANSNGTAGAPFYSWVADTDIGMYRATTNQLGFSTAGTERIRINASGNVGIGVVPNANNNILTVQQATTTGVAIWANTTANTNWVTVEASASSTTQGTGVSGQAFVAVNGTTTNAGAGWAGFFSGDVGCTGTYFGSDKRWKKNISSLKDDKVLSKLMLLEPKKYNFDAENFPGMAFDSEKTHFGFIAQDLEKIFPNVVSNNKSIPDPKIKRKPGTEVKMATGYYMVNYVELIPILTKGIQEQQQAIEEQNAKIEALEKIVLELQQKINQ